MQSAGESKHPPLWIRGIKGLLLPLGLLAAYGASLANMWSQWFPAWRQSQLGLKERIFTGDSYYTHAPFVPLISLLMVILIIRHRPFLLRPAKKTGTAVLAFSLLIHLVGTYTQTTFISGIGLILSLAALVLLAWGPHALRALWFPLAFLLFMAPLPEISLGQINFHLKMLSTDWAVHVANFLGIAARREGNHVILPGGQMLVVANICNGLRCLISLVAFGALFAYLCRLRGLWRPALFLMTAPVAFVSNTIRIASLIVVADVRGVSAALGWFHALSGLVTYVAAFLLMFLLENIAIYLRRLFFRPVLPLRARRKLPELNQWPALRGALLSRTCLSAAAILIAFSSILAGLGLLDRPQQPRVAKSALPERLEIKGSNVPGVDLALDQDTLNALGHPTYLYRRYAGGTNAPVDLCIIVSKDRPCSAPPDLNAENDGNDVIARGAFTIRDNVRAALPCRELIIQGSHGLQYLLYTYKCGAEYTESFWKQQALTFLDTATTGSVDCILVHVTTPVADSLQEARQRSISLLCQAEPYLNREFH